MLLKREERILSCNINRERWEKVSIKDDGNVPKQNILVRERRMNKVLVCITGSVQFGLN